MIQLRVDFARAWKTERPESIFKPKRVASINVPVKKINTLYGTHRMTHLSHPAQFSIIIRRYNDLLITNLKPTRRSYAVFGKLGGT